MKQGSGLCSGPSIWTGLVGSSVHHCKDCTDACAIGTGEHGVGLGKKDFLYEELGEGTLELMRTIKKAIDPLNLFNPGKVRLPSTLYPLLLIF